MSGLRARASSPSKWRVVIIPGAPSKFVLFQRLLRLAPPQLDVSVVMRAGYGDSRRTRREPILSFEEQIAAIMPLLQQQDDCRTIVMGVSYGGALALKAAIDNPHLIGGVLTCAMLVDKPRSFANVAVEIGGMFGVQGLLPEDAFIARHEIVSRRSQIAPIFSRLSEMRQPVSILHGDRDHLVSLGSARELRAYFRQDADISLTVVPGGTHYIEFERPRLVLGELQKLINRAERQREKKKAGAGEETEPA
ncbi:MAG: alpha/beta fold hydrolase [Pseudomonadota bacterium]